MSRNTALRIMVQYISKAVRHSWLEKLKVANERICESNTFHSRLTSPSYYQNFKTAEIAKKMYNTLPFMLTGVSTFTSLFLMILSTKVFMRFDMRLDIRYLAFRTTALRSLFIACALGFKPRVPHLQKGPSPARLLL